MSRWENREFNKSEFRYVSDGLSECYKGWTPVNPVLIDAPTGSGKNTFILETIIPSLVGSERILMLGNRTALNLQFKRKLYEKVGGVPISDRDLNQRENFGEVWIVSYQKILQYLNMPTHPIHKINAKFKYIIMDEAHFFLSDARFNPETTLILYSIINKYLDSGIIYMTATPHHIKNLIHNIHCDWYHRNICDNNSADACMVRHGSGDKSHGVHTYTFQANYSNCEFCFFSEWDILAKQIAASPSDEKWLVFVKSISEGNELKERLSKAKVPSNQIMTIDASKKDSEEYGTIVRRERFEGKVLITTSVIDNGVNIKDSMLKHVVIHSLDPVTAIQMAGRKRRDDGETVNLYFKTPTKQEVQQAINSTVQLKTFAESVLNDGSGSYLRNHWGQISEAEQKLLLAQNWAQTYGVLPIFTLQVNQFALEKLSIDHGELETLKDILVLEPEEGYQKLVLGWFNNPTQPSSTKILKLTPELVERQMTELKKWLDEMVAKGPLTEKETMQAETELARFCEDILREKMSISCEGDGTNRVKRNISNALTQLSLSEMYTFDKLKVDENIEYELPKGTFYWRFKKK